MVDWFPGLGQGYTDALDCNHSLDLWGMTVPLKYKKNVKDKTAELLHVCSVNSFLT